MGNAPWLDSLDEDWVSLPATPTSPVPTRSINHSRRSSLQNSPSRIPIPARQPVKSPRSSPFDPHKKVTRPCHFVRREAPTPKKYQPPRTPSKLRSPVPDKTKQSPRSNPPSARKKKPGMDTRSPLRSVSNVSSQQGQQSTVQVRPQKNKEKEGTPEWRKRLVHGVIPPGEQRDLFAPIGLESVFKPPMPGSGDKPHEVIPNLKQTDDLWGFDESSLQTPSDVDRTVDDDSFINNSKLDTTKETPTNGDEPLERSSQGPGLLEINKDTGKTRREPSASHNISQDDTQMRTVSGLEDLRNEGITPITFSRTNTVDGNATSEVIKSALKQVTSKLEKLSLPPRERPNSRASDSILFNRYTDPATDGLPDEELFDVTSHSLPQDLSTGTLDYRGRGAFINLPQDQYTNDSSTHKRRLPPPSFPSHRLSPFLPPNSRIRSSPPFYNRSNPLSDTPAMPRPSSAHVRPATASQAGERDGLPSSGSPLKLFGNHDTFTNNRLMRRMSQFEETADDLSEGEDEPVSPSEAARRKGESRIHLSAKYDRHERSRSRNIANPRVNRFGDGQLDHFGFSDTSPYEPKLLNHEAQEMSGVGPSSRRRRLRRHSSDREYSMESTLNISNQPRAKSILQPNTRFRAGITGARDMEPQPLETEWTRNTPAKDPTAKRRRTVLSPEQEDDTVGEPPGPDGENLSLLQRSLIQQGVRYEENDLLVPPESAPRPRTPTPSQIRSSTRQNTSPTRNLPPLPHPYHDDEDSLFDTNVPKVRVTGVNEEIRKGSITTQDFLSEATKIMDIIRSQGRNTDGLPSVEESVLETDTKSDLEAYEDDSTEEEFSRPPSREGVDMRKLRQPKAPNPRVLSHLKKFQEQDDLELSVSNSLMSLYLEEGQMNDGGIPEHRKRKLAAQLSDDDNDFLNTHISAKSLSARSIPTGSSQSSHAKGILPSDLVSHLIPEQVNGLKYDRYKNQWVKGNIRRSTEKPKTDDSEEDPFQDIPDLSVDELQEMMRIQCSLSPDQRTHSAPLSPVSPESGSMKHEPQPQAKSGELSDNSSSPQSKATRFTSSFPNSGTRTTSWGSDGDKNREPTIESDNGAQLREGRLPKPSQAQKGRNKQPRVVSISFSSPLVSQVAYNDQESPSKLRNGEKGPDSGQETKIADGAQDKASQPDTVEHSCLRPTMPRIDETGEETAENMSLMARNSTPERDHPDNSLAFLRNGQDTSYSFHLSPLPDFTVDQIDQTLQLEVSYVAQRTHPTSLRQVHGTFALATEELVKHITEAEPFEPYWEHVRRLILRHKGLITLHKLSDFCPRLEYLDVSFNDIGQLSGAPSTLRTLKIQENYLSNLTSWGHLVNLQYLDVSGNDLETLDGFSSLIHLRELDASDNNIQDIDGIFELDGLLSLKLGNNSLTAVDFEGAELTRLLELDISHNQLMSVRNLDSLSALTTLDLSFNNLSNVDLSAPLTRLRSLKLSNNQLYNLDVGVFPSLTLLYLDQNYLSTVSGLGQCRNLEIFSVREQTMSADNKNGFFDIDLGLVKDIRKVYLSSNRLSLQTVSPSNPLLSLQLLDAASCNIQTLPLEFALNFPNVKVLNLNFNSLTSINELVGMNCLSRLTVAGNCISRLRRLCQVLSVIGRTNKGKICSLQKVDVRGNPLTVRFYPPAVTGSGKAGDGKQLNAREEKQSPREDGGLDIPSALAEFKQEGQDKGLKPIFANQEPETPDHDIAINDPYTLPPADIQADTRYLAHLDRPTRLRRSIFELMLYAGTGGSVKILDGLDLRPTLQEDSDMDRAWKRLEKLGVLKKAITA
ncbi:hypothetical protein FE257_011721 [Aspergillus nanangensis]|uniref:Uncharacterized protein n=1 Tax=Aspergillus nanangensis TaxID=2582783 RepID=A0AAD4GXW1_ASPNN|nr:hypothetical protein FE257_011721 [Aspergillus nanangensis]